MNPSPYPNLYTICPSLQLHLLYLTCLWNSVSGTGTWSNPHRLVTGNRYDWLACGMPLGCRRPSRIKTASTFKRL